MTVYLLRTFFLTILKETHTISVLLNVTSNIFTIGFTSTLCAFEIIYGNAQYKLRTCL